MKISLRWLEEFVDVDVPIEKLTELLDFSGTKVEAVCRPGQKVDGVVVAEVLNIDEHPNADNLTLVDVRTDSATERVVCGARNFSVGDRVPYAQVGARLPEFEITERKIRGQVSRGMLCSGAELGISRDHSGILVLAPDAPLGQEVTGVLGLDDTIIELELTPNRPDCMGMVGVAREVAALLGNELRMPLVELSTSAEVTSDVRVEIEDPKGCPRYVARYIDGLKIAPSPTSISTRLLLAGIRPISNVVDITNYVLLELGHPLHAFDTRRVHEQTIVVRRARDRERLTTLDGVDRALHPDDLLIADPKKALAMAGVMGGEESEVSDDTTTVILESAYFDPPTIAYTARRHILRTEASARFERGADVEMARLAASRAASLIAEHGGGRIATQEVDAYPNPLVREKIVLRPERTGRLLGLEISAERQLGLLRSIQLDARLEQDVIEVQPPAFRPDLHLEVDLIEEVARLGGLQSLPSTLPPGRMGGLEPPQALERSIRRLLAGLGLYEAWTRSFLSLTELDDLSLADDHPARRLVKTSNPTTEREAALRTTLLPGLLRSAARNFAHRSAAGVGLFELARVYEPTDERLPAEALVLGAVFAGVRSQQGWTGPESRWDFSAAKGVLEALLEALRVPKLGFAPAAGMPFHPTRAASVNIGDTEAGALGEIHPEVCSRLDLPEGTAVFEIALAPIVAALPGRPHAEELPRFPSLTIDLAVVVAEDVTHQMVRDTILDSGAPEVISVRLFDVYRGDQVPEGSKSLAFALELRDPTRTLTDDDASAVTERVVAALRDRTGGELRR